MHFDGLNESSKDAPSNLTAEINYDIQKLSDSAITG